MKYKVIEYISDIQEEQTGTCEICFGTAMVENGSITVEDENGKATEISLTWWSWGDYFTIYIDNVVDFSAWLQERDKEYIDIPLLKSAVNELNMDIKNNPGLKYEIVGYSICKDETFSSTVSGILVRWEGTSFEKMRK